MLDRFERFSLAISEIDRYWHKLVSEEMAKYDLNSPHAIYLNALRKYEQGITAATLGELCGKDKSDVSRMVSILESKGLLQKETVGGNMYRARLKLTEKGKEAADYVRERAVLAVELAGAGLSDEDRDIFYRSLNLIMDNLKKLSQNGLPQR